MVLGGMWASSPSLRPQLASILQLPPALLFGYLLTASTSAGLLHCTIVRYLRLRSLKKRVNPLTAYVDEAYHPRLTISGGLTSFLQLSVIIGCDKVLNYAVAEEAISKTISGMRWCLRLPEVPPYRELTGGSLIQNAIAGLYITERAWCPFPIFSCVGPFVQPLSRAQEVEIFASPADFVTTSPSTGETIPITFNCAEGSPFRYVTPRRLLKIGLCYAVSYSITTLFRTMVLPRLLRTEVKPLQMSTHLEAKIGRLTLFAIPCAIFQSIAILRDRECLSSPLFPGSRYLSLPLPTLVVLLTLVNITGLHVIMDRLTWSRQIKKRDLRRLQILQEQQNLGRIEDALEFERNTNKRKLLTVSQVLMEGTIIPYLSPVELAYVATISTHVAREAADDYDTGAFVGAVATVISVHHIKLHVSKTVELVEFAPSLKRLNAKLEDPIPAPGEHQPILSATTTMATDGGGSSSFSTSCSSTVAQQAEKCTAKPSVRAETDEERDSLDDDSDDEENIGSSRTASSGEETVEESDNSGVQEEVVASAPECSICLQLIDVTSHDVLLVENCQHHYHTSCLASWLLTSGKCPLCTQELKKAIPQIMEDALRIWRASTPTSRIMCIRRICLRVSAQLVSFHRPRLERRLTAGTGSNHRHGGGGDAFNWMSISNYIRRLSRTSLRQFDEDRDDDGALFLDSIAPVARQLGVMDSDNGLEPLAVLMFIPQFLDPLFPSTFQHEATTRAIFGDAAESSWWSWGVMHIINWIHFNV